MATPRTLGFHPNNIDLPALPMRLNLLLPLPLIPIVALVLIETNILFLEHNLINAFFENEYFFNNKPKVPAARIKIPPFPGHNSKL